MIKISDSMALSSFSGAKSKSRTQAKTQIKPNQTEACDCVSWSKATPGERTKKGRLGALLAAVGIGVTAPAGVYRVISPEEAKPEKPPVYEEAVIEEEVKLPEGYDLTWISMPEDIQIEAEVISDINKELPQG